MDRFAIVEGHYLYYSEYHEGQWSDKYRRLSRISRYFNPSPLLHNANDLESEARDVYAALVDKNEGGVDLVVSIYGDGALLDACLDDDPDDLRVDDEAGDNGELQPTARLRLSGVPTLVALAAVDYCRHDNMGPQPYRDGYEAMECVATAKKSEVYECGVGWSPAECKRLDGCFLCGGTHEGN
jgi:hypothetical protein